MAPSTPSRTTASGKYSQDTVLIQVGPTKFPFQVHLSFLQRTAFFEVHQHTDPRATPQGTPTPIDREQTLSPSLIKAEEGTETDGSEGRATGTGHDKETPAKLTFHLEGFVYEPAAFEVVVGWLYNSYPEKPQTRDKCKTLLRAYVLALQYKITDLQDAIVNCYRAWHRDYNAIFEDLIWLINRLGEQDQAHNIPIVKYLVEQIAFEIFDHGYSAFASRNIFFETFLVEGNRPIRKIVVEAIAEVARARPPIDPATGPNRWRVQDWPFFPRTTPQEDHFNVVDIEE